MSVSYTGLQWESTNAWLRHPFSESASFISTTGVELPNDAIVDAFVFPTFDAGPWWDGIEPSPPKLVKADFGNGILEFSFNGGVLVGTMSEKGSARVVDENGADCGVVVKGPGWDGLSLSSVSMDFDGVELSSSAFCPVSVPGVSSFANEDRSVKTTCTNVEFVGDGVIKPIVERSPGNSPGDWRLRFDVYRKSESEPGVVRQLIVACVGRTPFDIADMEEMEDGNAVFLSMPSVDRDDVCWNAHREDDASIVVDTCEPETSAECPPTIPPVRNRTITICPSEVTGAIEIVPGDTSDGYKNPIRISIVPGKPNLSGVRRVPGISNEELIELAGRAMGPADTYGNGIMISIPGTGVSK